ncbi:hypothetical protein DUNSADRAFT_2825, partial [Dunaliella salina]
MLACLHACVNAGSTIHDEGSMLASQSGLPGLEGHCLTVRADNTLQAFDRVTGFRRWAVQLPSVPLTAYSSVPGKGGTNYLAPSKTAAVAAAAELEAGQRMPMLPVSDAGTQGRARPGRGICAQLASFASWLRPGSGTCKAPTPPLDLPPSLPPSASQVVVGLLQGNLYALPADHVVLEGVEEAPPMDLTAACDVSGVLCTKSM